MDAYTKIRYGLSNAVGQRFHLHRLKRKAYVIDYQDHRIKRNSIASRFKTHNIDYDWIAGKYAQRIWMAHVEAEPFQEAHCCTINTRNRFIGLKKHLVDTMKPLTSKQNNTKNPSIARNELSFEKANRREVA